MKPFKVELFYNRNEYVRLLDILEGDADVPTDLLDAFVEGIREQLEENEHVEEPTELGTVVVTSYGATYTRFAGPEILYAWISTYGAFASWDAIEPIAFDIHLPGDR